ncbi:unnamed protein product, partial [Phytophthora fragariaefolia]
MSSSSDSVDSRKSKSKRKGFKIGSSGTPVRWDGGDWTFYKHAMQNAFEKNLLDGIAKGDETEDTAWDDVKKGEFKKKQAEIKILIQGSLSMRLAKQVMLKSTGTEMWQELVTTYEGKSNPAMTAQKVYRLQSELHRTNLRGKDDVRGHLYKLFDIKTQLEDLRAPVNDLQMVDRMLRSLPTAPCYNELRRKVLFSSNMAKYTPDVVRELILTAELRSTDCDNNAFGNKQGNTAHQIQSSAKKGTKKRSSGGDPNKKSGKTTQAKYARSGEKFTEQEAQGACEVDHAQKRDVVVGEVVKRVAKDYDPSRWYFDTGSNAHITACKEYFTSMQSMENSDWNPTTSGFADGVGAKAEGFGTIMLAAMIDEQMVFVLVEDVLYVPSAGCNLFSPELALVQGFQMTWDSDARMFGMSKEGTEVIRTVYENRLWTFNAHNIGSAITNKKNNAVKKQVFANFCYHGWCGRHRCVARETRTHLSGGQRRKAFKKKLDRPIEKVNDIVYAELLIPGANNGSQYSAVLVVMDGFSRYVKIFLLKSKAEGEVNKYMPEYIAWAERQHRTRVGTMITREWSEEDDCEASKNLVRQVLTVKGQEFCNGAMEKWYKKKGIVHTKVGPNALQLNAVERTHQTLVDMVKTMMHQSGLPASFWTSALETAVYVKNRVFCKGAGCTPYEMMFDSKPDIHHIRAFGSLAYCHTPKLQAEEVRDELQDGVLDWTFNEFINEGEFDDFAADDHDGDDSSHQAECDAESERCASSNIDMEDIESVAGSEDDNAHGVWNGRLRSRLPTIQLQHQADMSSENSADRELWDESLRASSLPDYDDAFEETQEGEGTGSRRDSDTEVDPEEAENNSTTEISSENMEVDNDSAEAVSETAAADAEGQSDYSDQDENEDEHEVEVDEDYAQSIAHITDLTHVVETELRGGADYDCLFDPADARELSEVADDVNDGNDGAWIPVTDHELVAVPDQITGHRRPRDVDVYSAFKALHTDRRDAEGIRASDVKIPRTRREAIRSKYAPFWEAAMVKQVAALRAKGVLKMIPKSELPKDQKLLKAMWVYGLKEDHLGYVTEFRARIVDRGDKQRPGLDYLETFSPVARMATFRLFVAVSIFLVLIIYQGDINTAYLNALLTIKQYLEDLDGYPCEVDGMVYMINKALYGLKLSGREWNTEVNDWFIRYGFKRCSPEPCLYFYERDGEFAIVLLYVDDILCATKNEEFKKKMFNQLNEDYGLKDQGLLNTYLGIE